MTRALNSAGMCSLLWAVTLQGETVGDAKVVEDIMGMTDTVCHFILIGVKEYVCACIDGWTVLV